MNSTSRYAQSGMRAPRLASTPEWIARIASFELLERKLTAEEKEEVFDVFNRVGERMGIPDLPHNYNEWLLVQKDHLQHHLQRSKYTDDLFKQYRKHLGPLRYKLLLEGQVLVVPKEVSKMLGYKNYSLMTPIIAAYKLSRAINLDWFLKALVLPKKYKKQIKALDAI